MNQFMFAQRRRPQAEAFAERRLRNTRELICLSAPSSTLGACILGGASVQRSGGGCCCYCSAAFLESVNQPTTVGGGGPRRCYFPLPLLVHLFLSTSNSGPRPRSSQISPAPPPNTTNLLSTTLTPRRHSPRKSLAALGKLSNHNNWCCLCYIEVA